MTLPSTPQALQQAPVRFWQAFGFWLKLGFVSFGGPAGQIAMMHRELVERRRWMSESRFMHALNYCMVLPGPEAQQLATYIGWLMHRTWGGVAAGVLFVLPSLLILIGLSWVYVAYGQVAWVAAVFWGIKPAVTAIVLQAAHRIGSKALKNGFLWAVAAASFVAIFALHAPFPLIVLCAALAGWFMGRIRPDWFKAGGGHAGGQKQTTNTAPAWIDDHTPTPAHAQFAWPRLIAVVAVGVVLWAVPFGLAYAYLGANHTLTAMAWFFTKAALLTFGGAYAVLPYVYQGAVSHFGWLSPKQMVDGLALGESTPGPLIMVVAFVAFVGGTVMADMQTLFAGNALQAGSVAAALVTWFTFLPSFIFIFAGAPFIETTHGRLSFTAPLACITAAVVGVIANLALFFAYHVFWPNGINPHGLFIVGAGVDWPAVAIALAAGVALFKLKRSVIQVLAASALLGLFIQLFGA